MKQKLIVSFIITLFLLLSLGTVSILKIIQQSNLIKNMYNRPLSIINSTQTIQSNIISIHGYMKDILLANNKTQIYELLKRVNKSDEIIYKEFNSVLNKNSDNKKDIQNSYHTFVNWKPIREEITAFCLAGNNISAEKIIKGKCATHVKLLNKQVSELIKYSKIKANLFLNNSMIIRTEAILTTSVMLFLILIIITILLFSLLKHLNKAKKDTAKQNTMLLHQSRLAQMGEMISMIAHQWRQPLGAISATSIDLQISLQLQTYDLETKDGQEGLTKHCYESLQTIDSLVRNLTTTINDFRDFYKSNKKSSITLIRSPIKKVFDIIRKSLDANNVSIVESYNSTKKVEIYFNEFMQVMLNIIKNAQDNFNEKNIKQAKLTITCTDTKNGIKVLITDNGGGIPEDILPSIFDPYFSTKEKKNGTGLGLYMSKIIIEGHHNGCLDVTSTYDNTNFIISLKEKLIT